jgi:hypothetical protein
MNVNSCFNFKLRRRIGVFGSYIHDVNGCNEWKIEKHHECTNIGKLRTTRIMMAARYIASGSDSFRPLHFCWTECT